MKKIIIAVMVIVMILVGLLIVGKILVPKTTGSENGSSKSWFGSWLGIAADYSVTIEMNGGRPQDALINPEEVPAKAGKYILMKIDGRAVCEPDIPFGAKMIKEHPGWESFIFNTPDGKMYRPAAGEKTEFKVEQTGALNFSVAPISLLPQNCKTFKGQPGEKGKTGPITVSIMVSDKPFGKGAPPREYAKPNAGGAPNLPNLPHLPTAQIIEWLKESVAQGVVTEEEAGGFVAAVDAYWQNPGPNGKAVGELLDELGNTTTEVVPPTVDFAKKRLEAGKGIFLQILDLTDGYAGRTETEAGRLIKQITDLPERTRELNERVYRLGGVKERRQK